MKDVRLLKNAFFLAFVKIGSFYFLFHCRFLTQKPNKEVEPKKPAEAPLEKKTEAPKPVESSSSTSGQILTCKNPANCERTFLMLKPDAVHRGLAGQIIARFEKKGFKLVAMKFMKASTDLLSKHYADLSKKPFFPELVR